jgi:hypothetical protein
MHGGFKAPVLFIGFFLPGQARTLPWGEPVTDAGIPGSHRPEPPQAADAAAVRNCRACPPFADGDEGGGPCFASPSQRAWAANCSGRGRLADGSRSS